jgi:hypothetical protein
MLPSAATKQSHSEVGQFSRKSNALLGRYIADRRRMEFSHWRVSLYGDNAFEFTNYEVVDNLD